MLSALFSVVENEKESSDPIFILSSTAVVHTYCRNHQSCGESEEVQNFINFLETNVLEQIEKNLLIRANREKVCYELIFTSQKQNNLYQNILGHSSPSWYR